MCGGIINGEGKWEGVRGKKRDSASLGTLGNKREEKVLGHTNIHGIVKLSFVIQKGPASEVELAAQFGQRKGATPFVNTHSKKPFLPFGKRSGHTTMQKFHGNGWDVAFVLGLGAVSGLHRGRDLSPRRWMWCGANPHREAE